VRQRHTTNLVICKLRAEGGRHFSDIGKNNRTSMGLGFEAGGKYWVPVKNIHLCHVATTNEIQLPK
jgi:hypothetical protein